jgi:hypothetical protein
MSVDSRLSILPLSTITLHTLSLVLQDSSKQTVPLDWILHLFLWLQENFPHH